MLETKQRFGFSVAVLLSPESSEREAPVMPDDCGGAEADDLSLLLQAPAKIHVVAGLAIFRIEAADLLESPFVKGHVAAGDVLGDQVGKEHVVRTTGRGGDAGLNPVLGGR